MPTSVLTLANYLFTQSFILKYGATSSPKYLAKNLGFKKSHDKQVNIVICMLYKRFIIIILLNFW